MLVVREPIGEATIAALHEVASDTFRKCGEASLLNPDVPTVARIAALAVGIGAVGQALHEGRDALADALVACASVAVSWGQCWSGDGGCPFDSGEPDLRVLTAQTVADLQYTAVLCARPGGDHCQLTNLPVSRRLALLGVDYGEVAGWLVRVPARPDTLGRVVWLRDVHGALVHLAVVALTWAHYLEVSGVG